MATPAKEQAVAELNQVFQKARAVVLTNYQGITADQTTAMRAHLRKQSVQFRVIKNSLARRAAKGTPFEGLDVDFKGPVSVVVSFDDALAPAKALSDYGKTGAKKSPEVLCGLVEGKRVTPAQIQMLSDLPPREVLIAQMLATFQGPTTSFVGVFSSLLRKLVGTLDAVREKKASQ